MSNSSPVKKFEFKEIEGKLDLEKATEQLVHIAKCVQNTHTFESASVDWLTLAHMFDVRKAGILTLLNLIEEYVNQKKPNNK